MGISFLSHALPQRLFQLGSDDIRAQLEHLLSDQVCYANEHKSHSQQFRESMALRLRWQKSRMALASVCGD